MAPVSILLTSTYHRISLMKQISQKAWPTVGGCGNPWHHNGQVWANLSYLNSLTSRTISSGWDHDYSRHTDEETVARSS